MRPRHCTPLGLRPAISPNVGNSGAEFLVVGVRVRAAPDEINEKKDESWIMGPVRMRHSSHDFGWQSSHSVDLTGWQAKMTSFEIWIPLRNAHKPHSVVQSSSTAHSYTGSTG